MISPPRERNCAACNERVLVDGQNRCLWCNGPTTEIATPPPRPRRRRGGKPEGKWGKIPPADLRKLHRIHYEGWVSINAIAKQVWQRYGYASPAACGNSISRFWARMDLPAHDRITMTRRASTIHGRASRDRRNDPEKEKAYRAWLAEQRGWLRLSRPGNPPCGAPTTNGDPCRSPARHGETTCAAHAPENRERLTRQLAAMRARRNAKRNALPLAPLALWLYEQAERLGSQGALAKRLGVSRTTVSQLISGKRTPPGGGPRRPFTTIGEHRVRHYLEIIGRESFEDLYPNN